MHEYSWIEWSGGERPVSEDTQVVVKLRDPHNKSGLTPTDADGYDGDEASGFGASWWKHQNEWYDIVAYAVVENKDEPTGPVRTVTRREIVPGVYGDVHVDGGLVPNSVSIHFHEARASASMLRSAAMVLSQLAEALDDNKDAGK